MTREQLERLFEPFNRLGRERGGAEGTGLGLMIVKSLAEQMNGELTVRSVPEHGSTFGLSLPRAEAGDRDVLSIEQPAPAPQRSVGMPGRRHVLYVDDDPVSQELMSYVLLQRPDLELTVLGSAAAAIEHIASSRVDLLLLDRNIGSVDGIDLIRQLRARSAAAQPRVLMVSADLQPQSIDLALSSGADAFLGKLWGHHELLRVIDALLASRDGLATEVAAL